MKTPILGSSYTARSSNAADDRMVNLFPEVIPQGGKEPGYLLRAPGLLGLQVVGSGGIRGLWTSQSRNQFYVVSGQSVYKLTSTTGTPVLIGTVTGTNMVSIADNGDQVFFACNPDAFIYTESTGAFAQITDADFPGAVTVGYINTYFCFNEPGTGRFWLTAILDGFNIDALDFATAESSPDNLAAVIVDHQQVWMHGTGTTEVWYDANAVDFPLSRIQGSVNELGCIAPYSVVKLDNSHFWLGGDDQGQGIVYRANVYVGVRISTHAMEWKIQEYDRIDDAIAYSYQMDGHEFYVINFPTGNATWVYDVATRLWHERAYFKNGSFERHRGIAQCNFNGAIVIGDYETGDIYQFDMETYTDNGATQKWLRSWRALGTGQNNLKRSIHHALQLDCESGVGLNSGQGSDPQVMLRWSDDGGHTWSNEHWESMGKIGKYGERVKWWGLGATLDLRDRVYEVSGTDPVKIAIMGAELTISGTNA